MFKSVAKKVLGEKSPPLSKYQYFIDVIDAGSISGWAKKIDAPTHSPEIKIASGEKTLWIGKANQPREDLIEQGVGECAFNITPDVAVLDIDITHIDIYVDNHKVNDIPYPFKLSKESVVLAVPEEVVEPLPDIDTINDSVFHIDAVTNTVISGWAKSKSDDTKRLNIEFRAEGVVLATGRAEQYRSDLKDAHIGDGQYGYLLQFDLANFPSSEVAADLYIDGVAAGGEPFVFAVDEKKIESAKFQAKFAEQYSMFEKLSADELARITEQISEISKTGTEQSINVAINVALQNIAELSARMHVIEKVLIDKIAD